MFTHFGTAGFFIRQPAGREPDHSPTVNPTVNEGDDEPVPESADHRSMAAGDGDAGVDELAVGEPGPPQVLEDFIRAAAGGGIAELPAPTGWGVRGQVDEPAVGQGGDGQGWAVAEQPFPVTAGGPGQGGA